jgi:pheromone shutdown protein TraB
LSSQERIFIGWMARGFLNWSLKQSEDISTMLTAGVQAKLFEVIIDRRNDRIVEYIVTHPKQKIAVVYGALHFNGVYEALQKKDKNWKTIHMKNSTPYTR